MRSAAGQHDNPEVSAVAATSARSAAQIARQHADWDRRQKTWQPRWFGRTRSPYQNVGRELEKALAGTLNAEGNIRRVFYPLGGPDVASVLGLFAGPKGGPREILILD